MTLDELLGQLRVHITDVQRILEPGRKVHPEQFTELITRLALKKEELGEFENIAYRDKLVAEREAYNKAIEDGKGVTAAKEERKYLTIDKEVLYTKIKNERGDIRDIMEMLRSHASAVREDK